jgi:CheY-like chemotaxis protein
VTDQQESSKKKVLVADDDAVDIYLVRKILESEHSVIEASDGEQAVALAQKHEPDIVLMDMMMPKKDGLTACSEIRANPTTKDTPIIMLTGVGYELNAKLAGALGVTKYITKPFKPQELLDTVNSLLALRF